ncbi:hypothetical protein GGR51DRAFT_564789 [Nemania sp. FL0031]|nr:hypothetical protein GGR51DRAFT_564789 [Nemania sp. FL0031]
MAPQDSSEQCPQGSQTHSSLASLSDPSKEEAILPESISTNEVPFPSLSNAQSSVTSFNDLGSGVTNVHHTPGVSNNVSYRGNTYFEDETQLLDDICSMVPTSQPDCSIPYVGLHDSFLLSPPISEPKILTQGSNTPQTCDYSTPAQGLDGNQPKCWSETSDFSSMEGVEQILNQPPFLNTHSPIQVAQIGIETSKEADHKNCTCLKSVIFLINELEPWTGSSKTLNALELCSSLAEHKRAVRKGEGLVQCEECSTLPENMIMLGLLVDRLLVFCEKIILSYITTINGQLSLKHKDLFFGEFEVDTDTEWALLLGGLIALQIKSLALLIEGTSRVGGSLGSKLETSKLKIQHLRQLLGLRLPSGVMND